jgi:acyl-CoA thioester hydrolase
VHFTYEVVRESDGTLLAEGETTHIVTDAEMKITTIPEKYLTTFRGAISR